jgi:hypothetical protein
VTAKESKVKLQRIEKAMESFPKEVRRQERAYRQEMKVRAAFGKISLEPKKVKKK